MAASVTGREANFCPRAEGQRQSSGTETSPLTSALWGAFCPPLQPAGFTPAGGRGASSPPWRPRLRRATGAVPAALRKGLSRDHPV